MPAFILLLCLLQTDTLNIEIYRFAENNVEFWYQLPVSSLCTSLDSAQPASYYNYNLSIYTENMQDSIIKSGTKAVAVKADNVKENVIDFFLLYLEPRTFTYCFDIATEKQHLIKTGTIELSVDTMPLSISDLILSRKIKGKIPYARFGTPLNPAFAMPLSPFDTLFSYCEIYNAQPDSTSFDAKYCIMDSTGRKIIQKDYRRLKYDYTQQETLSISLFTLAEGNYQLTLDLVDQANKFRTFRTKRFKLNEITDSTDYSAMKYYYSIQYLVSGSEYKKFLKLDDRNKKSFLRKFWMIHSYPDFEYSVLAADAKFSTSRVAGRDTERGKYFIKNGAPDDIEIKSIEDWAKSFEVWRYSSRGIDAIFCDKKEDGNPVLVKILGIGEFDFILEHGFALDEVPAWLYEIAPGTYKKHAEKNEEQIFDNEGIK